MIKLVNNTGITARNVLAENLAWCNEFDFAPAYLRVGDKLKLDIVREGKIEKVVLV